MRIVHFSDLHFGLFPENFLTSLFDKRILGLTNFFLRRRSQMHRDFLDKAVKHILELKPQLTVCTGDIASIGSEREFEQAGTSLDPLINNPDFDFLYIPGNHDNYVPNQHNKQALEIIFKKLNKNRWKLNDLPIMLKYSNTEIMVCNETEPTNIFLSSGRLNKKTINTLQKWFSQKRQNNFYRVLIGHYPTRDQQGEPLSRRRRLNGGELIYEALKAGSLDVSLCGHIHDPFCHRQDNGSLEVCAGALPVKGTLNVIDLPRVNDKQIKQTWYFLYDKEKET